MYFQVVGPFANQSKEIMGDYNPDPSPGKVVTAAQGLAGLASHVQMYEGCSTTSCIIVLSDRVKKAAMGTDVNFVMLGTGNNQISKQTNEYSGPSKLRPSKFRPLYKT